MGFYRRYAAYSNSEIDFYKAFRVFPGKIVSYETHWKGFWIWREEVYTPAYTLFLSKDIKVKICCYFGSKGSGTCEVRSGEEYNEYHIYKYVDGFYRDALACAKVVLETSD